MDYLLHIAVLISIYSILGISLELVVGETGLVSVMHAAFFGVGAYASALLATDLHWNFFFTVPAAMLFCALVALPVAVVFSRFRGDFYVLGTLGGSIIVYSIFLNWQTLTNGPLGVSAIPVPSLFGFSFHSVESYLMLSLVCAALVYLVALCIKRSSFGRVLHAIREDEQAIAIFGYATSYYKLVIFVIGAMLAAVAGALFAGYLTYIDPSSFTSDVSVFLIAIIILGGLGSLRGAILGAVILTVLPEALRFVGFPTEIAAQMRQVVYGLILILLMLYRPQGLLGSFRL
jgi:branched-chain amino acid transport system permease protein